MRLFQRKLRLNLALQGGGAHGAFAWGVLDRLLEEERVEFGWISGTSAGAVNAVALAAGLAEGGRESARKLLRAVWEGVFRVGVPDLLRLNPFLYSLSQSQALAQVANLWSPYEFNPLNVHPLRQLLSETIDFERLRRASPVELLIAATDVKTGRARLFRRAELRAECVLASTCLPTLHHAVEIDGVAYWDGGFSANPDLITLASESPVRDTLIVQINPIVKSGVPRGAAEISDHASRLTFNAPLLRDVQVIESVRASLPRGLLGGPVGRGRVAKLARQRFHLIEASRYTGALSPGSKIKPDWRLFQYLYGVGCAEADKWLDRHGSAVGRRNSVDLQSHFLNAGTVKAFIAPPLETEKEERVVGVERKTRRRKAS